MINVNDIPKELLDRIRKEFDENPKVGMLRVQQRSFQDKGLFSDALKIAKELEALYNETVVAYINSIKEETQNIDYKELGMSKEEDERFEILLLVMFMACDIIDSATMDINSLIGKYMKDFKCDLFDDIREISSAAKAKIDYLQQNSDYLNDLVWGDKCDNMYDMMRSKAKAILNKKKTDKNYGRIPESIK